MTLRWYFLLSTAIGFALSIAALILATVYNAPFAVLALGVLGGGLCTIGFLLWWRLPPRRTP